jgi:murein DD-endopeptidase MepM/ murein hydrolase activator NlpD
LTENKRFYVLTTILTIFSTLLFNHLYASDFLVDTARNLVDTAAINLSDFYHNGHLVDLANLLPFHHYYMNWDTTMVHPYHFDVSHMSDTVMLYLADHGDCAFVVPVAGYITSNFGPRSKTRYHYGVDLKLNTGDTVVAAFDGMVRFTGYQPTGYGNVVVVRHYNGLETVYGHLSKIGVRPGDMVRAGEYVGLGGSTGHSSGPHLHFELRYLGGAINPNDVIDFTDSSNHTLKSETFEVSRQTFSYLNKGHYTSKTGSSLRYYTVRRGDTLSKIAVKNRTTINRLCQLNRVSRNASLRPGQKIKIR